MKQALLLSAALTLTCTLFGCHSSSQPNATPAAMTLATRPSSATFWNAYLNYDNIPSSEGSKVWDKVAGSIGEQYGPPNENSCATRVSYGLNYGGAPVLADDVASINYTDHKYKGVAGDGKRYVVSAKGMDDYLRRKWGAPDKKITTDAELASYISSLAEGKCGIFATPNPPMGRGHSGVLKKGYNDPHVKDYLPVDVWTLP